MRSTYIAAVFIAFLAAPALAQTAPSGTTMRVVGTVDKLDGNNLTVNMRDGSAVTVMLADTAAVFGAEKRTLADIKPGDYLASGGVKGTDGKIHAVDVRIFHETLRGTGEGQSRCRSCGTPLPGLFELRPGSWGRSVSSWYRQKEPRAARHPVCVINRNAAARDDHVHVRMMRHRRAPAVEHSGDADPGAKPLGIGGDRQGGLGRRREQQTVDRGFVVVGDIGDRTRQREHEVEIADGQQFGLALGEPFLGGGSLTLRAMPVAAAVVGNDSIGAVLAARDVTAERHRAAALDGRHYLQLVEADVPGIGSAPRRPVIAEDIRNLQRWTGHRRWLRRRRVSAALLGLLARLRQQVERALDAGDHAGGDTRITRRRLQFVMTQQRLDNSNTGAALEQVGGEAVAQCVQRHGLFDPGRVGRLVKQAAQLAGGHRLAAPVARKQPVFRHGCPGIVTRWARLPPLAQQTERLWRQHDIAVPRLREGRLLRPPAFGRAGSWTARPK